MIVKGLERPISTKLIQGCFFSFNDIFALIVIIVQLKRREGELKKQVVDVKKALTDEQSTVAKLKASLKEVGF